MKSQRSKSLKYKRFTPLGCKDINIYKIDLWQKFHSLAYFILLRKIKTRGDSRSQSGASNVAEI